MRLKNQALTPLQALVVILALFVFVGLGYGLYRVAEKFRHQRNVRASISKYLDGLRGQRDVLGQAVERYHAQLGFYPPNHSTSRTERASLNPLYYELVGTQWSTNYQSYRVPNAKETIKPETMEKIFHMNSFSNSLIGPSWPTNFANGLGVSGREEGEVILMGLALRKRSARKLTRIL